MGNLRKLFGKQIFIPDFIEGFQEMFDNRKRFTRGPERGRQRFISESQKIAIEAVFVIASEAVWTGRRVEGQTNRQKNR